MERVASVTHGFVGADLSALVRESALAAVRRAIHSPVAGSTVMETCVEECDLERAMHLVKPSAMREV